MSPTGTFQLLCRLCRRRHNLHKQANVLAALPKSAHPAAIAAMREIYDAEDIDKAQIAITAFDFDYGAKYPKAVAEIVDDVEALLELYKYSSGALDSPVHHEPDRPSAPYVCEPRSPKAPAHGQPQSPWRKS